MGDTPVVTPEPNEPKMCKNVNWFTIQLGPPVFGKMEEHEIFPDTTAPYNEDEYTVPDHWFCFNEDTLTLVGDLSHLGDKWFAHVFKYNGQTKELGAYLHKRKIIHLDFIYLPESEQINDFEVFVKLPNKNKGA